MSKTDIVCIICNEGATSSKRLVNNPNMIEDLYHCCNERLSLGQTDVKPLIDRLASLNELERKAACYHSECRKPIVNKSVIERLRSKRVWSSDSISYSVQGPGRPSNAATCSRPKRTKTIPKAEVCLFSACSFCPNDTLEALHRVSSDKMGENFLEIKSKTQDDQVRICVSELEDAGDASALEKYYHRKCLRNAQRTFKPIEMCSVNQLIHSACEEQLLLSVQNSLTDDDAILSMAEVNSTYVSILNRYRVQISETANYRKHLKKLLSERLPSVQFVKSLRKNEPDRIVLPRAVSKGIDFGARYWITAKRLVA